MICYLFFFHIGYVININSSALHNIAIEYCEGPLRGLPGFFFLICVMENFKIDYNVKIYVNINNYQINHNVTLKSSQEISSGHVVGVWYWLD